MEILIVVVGVRIEMVALVSVASGVVVVVTLEALKLGLGKRSSCKEEVEFVIVGRLASLSDFNSFWNVLSFLSISKDTKRLTTEGVGQKDDFSQEARMRRSWICKARGML